MAIAPILRHVPPSGHTLTASTTMAPLGAVGMTIRGEPAFGHGKSRHNLVSGRSKDPNHDAVMRIGSEAPKRRSPISPVGTKAKGHAGIPPPRTVIGASSQADGRDRNCLGVPSASSIHYTGRKQSRLVQRPPAQAATGRSEACAPRPRSWAFDLLRRRKPYRITFRSASRRDAHQIQAFAGCRPRKSEESIRTFVR